MSTATSASNVTHLPHNPHTAHSIPLREQAFTLHCQGLRSPAISQELGVPERTIRAWIAAALDDLKEDLQLNRKQQLLLAVERHNMITATAWQQFHHEAAARDAILDAALDTLANANDPNGANTPARAFHLHLPASTPAPRYLSLIIQANKEINRLLGLHTLAKLHLLTPDDPDMPETDPAPISDPDISAESATAFTELDTPAESATESQSAQADFAAVRHPGAVSTAGTSPADSATTSAPLGTSIVGASTRTPSQDSPIPAKTATTFTNSDIPAESATALGDLDIPAESATNSTTPCSSVASVASVLNPRSPAESATFANGLAAGIQPAHPHPTIPSPIVATAG